MNIHKTLEECGLILTKNLPQGGFWLLLDGYFLDLDLNYKEGRLPGGIYKTGVHSNVDNMLRVVLTNQGLVDSQNNGHMNLLTLYCGCIKLQTGLLLKFERPYIMLPQTKLSDEQYKQLELWFYQIYNQANKKYVEIFIAGFHGRTIRHIALKDDEYGLTPEDIIKDIKRFYNIGENQTYEEAIKRFMRD